MILVDGERADRLPVDDRGVQYGDGVFETIAVRDARPEYWQEHLARLDAGCRRLGFPMPDRERFHEDAERVLAGSPPNVVLKLIATRGRGGRGYRPPAIPSPTRIVMTAPYPDYPADFAADGIALHPCRTLALEHPELLGLKHLNRLPQVLARAEWDDPAIPEGLMCDALGHPIEGTQSNLFLVRDGVLRTCDLSTAGVAGIIRARLLALADGLDVPTRVERLSADALERADEVFVCNSLIGIWPVRALEQRRWAVGPITRRLQHVLDSERACLSGFC